MGMVDGQEPCFLYKNLLEDMTLTESSGGAALDAGALTNLYDGLTFTTATFSGFSGAAIVIQADAASGSDAFATSPQNPLTIGWTDVGDEALQVVSNYLTDTGQTAITASSTNRQYANDTATLPGGNGTVRADVYFSSTSAPNNTAGVSARSSVSGDYVAACLTNTGRVELIYSKAGAESFDALGKSYSVSATTYYEIKLVISGTTAKVYIDGTLEISSSFTPGSTVGAGFLPDQACIYQYDSTPASNTARWDNFVAGAGVDADTFAMSGQLFQGATGSTVGGSYTLAIEYSDDSGSTWTEVTAKGWTGTASIGSDATVFLRWDSTGTHDAYRFTFTDVSLAPSGSVTLAAMCLGKRLEFGEWMAHGFDPDSVSLAWEQNRNMSGQYVGGVVRNTRQSISLKFSSAGLANTFLHDPDNNYDTGSRSRHPSWGHFLKTCWSVGKPWWFQWACWSAAGGLHVHDGSFYSYPSSKSRTGAPFISPTRRRLRFAFDVMAEGYVGDFPLNDP